MELRSPGGLTQQGLEGFQLSCISHCSWESVPFLDGVGVEGPLVHLACCIRLIKSLTASGTLVAGAQYVAGVNVDDPVLDFVQHSKPVVASSVL